MRLPIAVATAIFLCSGVSRGTTVTNTTSESLAQIDTIVNTTATQTVDQYSTQLIAQLQGGSTLYDQTFNSAFSSPTVQAAVSAAENVLKGAGATSFSGPALESNNQTLLNSTTNTVQTGSHLDNTAVTVTIYVGPKTIYPGDYGVCQNYTPKNYPPVSGCTLSPAAFNIPAGGEDIDTFVIDFYTISEKTTTTNTYEIKQIYDLVGETCAASSVPEPGSWALALAGLLGLGCVWLIRRARPKYRCNAKLPIALATAILVCTSVSRGATVGGNDSIYTSESAAQVDTIVNTTATQTVDQYSTQLIAQLQGGSTLYDQTFNSAFSSPTVQAAVITAENVLKGAGATSFSGPALESNNQSLLGSTSNTVQTGSQLTNVTSRTTTYIGPLTIYPGDYGVCQNYTPGTYPPVSGCTLSPTAFYIPTGSEDIDTFIISFYTISEKTITTNTYEITQVYDLVGKTGSASSVPEPESWSMALAGLMALGCVWMIRRLRPAP